MARKYIAMVLIGCCLLVSGLTGCSKKAEKALETEKKTFTLSALTAEYDPSKIQILSGEGEKNTNTAYVFGADDDPSGMPEMSITVVSGIAADSAEEMELITGQTNGTYSDFNTYMFSDAPISGGSYTNQKGETVDATFSALLGMLVPKTSTVKSSQAFTYLFILYNGANPFSEADYQLYTDCIHNLVGDDATLRSYQEAMEQLATTADTEDSEEAYTEADVEDMSADQNAPAMNTKQGDVYVLSRSALEKAGRQCYIASKDFPIGSYKVSSTGKGSLEVHDGNMSMITQFEYKGADTDTLQDVSYDFADSDILIVTGDVTITLTLDNKSKK